MQIQRAKKLRDVAKTRLNVIHSIISQFDQSQNIRQSHKTIDKVNTLQTYYKEYEASDDKDDFLLFHPLGLALFSTTIFNTTLSNQTSAKTLKFINETYIHVTGEYEIGDEVIYNKIGEIAAGKNDEEEEFKRLFLKIALLNAALMTLVPESFPTHVFALGYLHFPEEYEWANPINDDIESFIAELTIFKHLLLR